MGGYLVNGCFCIYLDAASKMAIFVVIVVVPVFHFKAFFTAVNGYATMVILSPFPLIKRNLCDITTSCSG